MDDIHSMLSQQPPDRYYGSKAPASLGDIMDDDARLLCPACEQRISDRD
jgi:hypothetical protein